MKYTTIEIGGALRPCRFSYAALYEYEKNTGRSAIADFANMTEKGVSVSLATDLVFAGLLAGHKSAGEPVTFDQMQVAEWIFDGGTALEAAMNLFKDSFAPPNGKEDGGESEKKAKPQHGIK